MDEDPVIVGQDGTDSVRLTVTKEIHETLVDFQGDKKTGEKLNLTESLIESVVKIVIIDAEDYDDDTEKPDQYRLAEIWYNIQPLTNMYEIKQNLAKDLSSGNVEPGIFSDFNLGCISSLEDEISIRRARENENSIHNILKKSTPLYYLASLLLEYVCEHANNDETKALLKTQHHHLQNACNVLENAVEVNGWRVPDFGTTTNEFVQFKARLPDLVDEYLNSALEFRDPSTHTEGSRSRLLRQHKQLIINYEIVNEVERAISRLHDVFGTIKAQVLGDRDGGSFGIYTEVTERSTIWALNEESEINEHYA